MLNWEWVVFLPSKNLYRKCDMYLDVTSLTELGGGFSAFLYYIEGARKAPPDLQRTLYLSKDFGTK